MAASVRDELRIAIVACGALTELFYAPALTTLGRKHRLKVAALIDPNPARRAALQPTFPGSIGGATLADIPAGIDLAIVASPAGFHAAQTIELLGRGMHVLCEKPMARSAAECDPMIEAARAADRLLAIGHFKRFFPATRQIKELVEKQAFGRMLSFEFFDGGRFGWPAQSRTLFDREAGGGGVLIDIGVHALDLALWWFGEPSEVACADDAMGGVEANVAVTLAYPNGATGRLIASRDVDTPNRYIIEFERGWVAWDPIDANHIELGWGETYALKAATHHARSASRLPAASAPAPTRHQAFMLQIENVLEAIQGRGKVGVTGEDGRRVMALIDRCYANSTLLDMPWLSAAERQRGMELRCSR
ncbi:MAG TPA: Gfo/Idh/MocA family oxidoreductase [Alphaproteobacteria bacterium]|nr:Gfo/Idh/MocA family oxidoreductase [Alphaproteobacteria bacterium]